MIKKIKKPKITPISKLKKKADIAFSIWIRERDEHTCFTCGKKLTKTSSQCGHYIPRDVMQLRYDEINCNCQCVICNVFKKGNYPIYSQKIINKYGVEKLKELNGIYENRHSDIKKYGKDFYLNIISKYGNNL